MKVHSFLTYYNNILKAFYSLKLFRLQTLLKKLAV